MSVQQKPNVIDYGMFATAFDIDLLYGNSSSNVSYEHEKMLKTCLFVYNKFRSHLLDKKFYLQFRCLLYFPGRILRRRY